MQGQYSPKQLSLSDSCKTKQQSVELSNQQLVIHNNNNSSKHLKTQFYLKSQKFKKQTGSNQQQQQIILNSQNSYSSNKHDNKKVNKRVYILYTSGCAGADQKLDIYEGYLREKIINNAYLCDYKLTMQNRDTQTLISPILQNGRRVQYQIQQMELILGSINSSVNQIVKIANKIQQNYHNYDAFIILTGFDLMSYISTMLSFMLQNLNKCVIFTGGNFPISFARNDFINNIIQSFCIISLSKGLNDVLIVCKNKGYRANRSIKVKQSQMDTIKSPNMHSLVSIDIKIRFKIHLFLPIPEKSFNVFCNISEKIHILKFHIFVNKQILKYQLKNPNIIGYVIQSYTGANLPEDPQLLQIFKDASQKDGKIFVNISQNIYKEKKSIMKEYLQKFDIYFGGDMTVQAALAKMSYLVGKGYSKQQIIEKISMNLRGQLTETKNQNQFEIQTQGFMQAIQTVLQDYYPTSTQKVFTDILEDEIGRYISSSASPQQFKIIYKYKFCKNYLLNHNSLTQEQSLSQLINRNNLLHLTVLHDNLQLMGYFLSLAKINKDKLDQNKCSAFYYALKQNNKPIIQLLHKNNCHVVCHVDDLMDLMLKQIKKDNVQFFQLLYHIQFKMSLSEIVNIQKRNIAHLAALLGALKCLQIFLGKFKFQIHQKDINGLTVEDYIKQYKKRKNSQE